MRLNEIIERFSLVSGLEKKEISRLLPILLDCKAFFEARIRRELTDAERRRAAYACAVFAYYRISCFARTDGIGSFKAGDFQFTAADTAAAERLWEAERSAVADLVAIDDAFSFRAVDV